MFEDLFIDRDTIARYRCAPLLEERLSYLKHCAQAGVRPLTLRRIATDQTSLVHLLGLREAESVSMCRIEAAADRRSSRPVRPEVRRSFVGHAVQWLRFVGLLEEACTARHAHADEVAVFGDVDAEGALDEWGIALDSVGVADVDRAVARWQARGCRRTTIRNYAQQLRTFFRFAERRGWCTPGLAGGIMPLRFHPGETVPKGLNRDEVLRLLKTSEGDRPVDVRDRAILMVLIAYGLRSGEVRGLRLDDVDWAEDALRVRRPKPGRTHHYPLSRGVGQAIVRYITEVRPPRPERTLA